MNTNQTSEAGEMPEVRWCYDDHEQVFHYCDPQEVSAALSAARAAESHLRAQLAEAEKERDHHKSAEEMAGRAMSQMVKDAYDIVYAGEPEDEREVRWKWVLIGLADMRAERDAAQARVGEMEGLLRRCQPHIRYDKSCQCSGCDGLRQLNLSIDAALATSPNRPTGGTP